MLKDMKSYCHVKPGQKGSKRLVEQYGDRLLCVRYRYDEKRRIRLKTVEIIVEERPWQPPFRYCDNELVPLTVGYEETELREKLRGLRAKWDPDARVWLVPYGKIKGTELEKRIFDEDLAGRKKV
ncbi:hypothetical protein [Pelobacter propionicus]|nr:hypothetical protein [Pelobacter propionicus]